MAAEDSGSRTTLEVARQVVWVQNKGGNTGKGGGLAALLGEAYGTRERPGGSENILVQKTAGTKELKAYVLEKGWVEHKCPLANRLLGPGKAIKVWDIRWQGCENPAAFVEGVS